MFRMGELRRTMEGSAGASWLLFKPSKSKSFKPRTRAKAVKRDVLAPRFLIALFCTGMCTGLLAKKAAPEVFGTSETASAYSSEAGMGMASNHGKSPSVYYTVKKSDGVWSIDFQQLH